ncbi:hypothetical protein DEU34_1857 [Microbacterium sp. AG1240]|uniref:DUF402 domain-containing protein n=1 Tax=Microbacterium sp. AG1240 TaxID=2183992 RepID=UPI000EAF4A4E|nr:DUF402 domain-containing protein [Microbacterium sp. AG1240]RKT33267.1 hypothetical protein DEU34_1857 [Microbacterium sp. AG1240]
MTTRPAPGTRLVFRWRKWDASTHWVHDCVYLGSDEFGDWFGQFAGWRSHRPGRDVVASTDNVTLLPPSGEWVFTANAPAHRTRVYIDLAWDARWDAGVPTGIDMDLDVVEQADRGVWIDDRDEWEEHRVRYGYPLDIVDRLEAVTLELEARVTRREAPFDDATIDRWLGRMTRLHGSFDTEAPQADH